MTSLAKVEANQRNAAKSTGPRTMEGKAIVSRNATRHGIFSSVPVIPGEDLQVWQSHRAGVVESLGPIGLLEVNLAERAALVLWRLQRLARYEAEMVAAAIEDAAVPPLPPPEEETFLDTSPKQQTREEQLRELRRQLRAARQELIEVKQARGYFRNLPEAESEGSIPFPAVETILEAACSRAEAAEDLRSDPPNFGSKPFLRKLALTGVAAEDVTWTPELLRRGLALYATYSQESPEPFTDAVRIDLDEWAEELGRKVRRLECEANAIARFLERKTARRQTAKLLPSDGQDERIAKYERHLHNLLTSTLHELERFQARREGEIVPPPAVADVNVTMGTGTG